MKLKAYITLMVVVILIMAADITHMLRNWGTGTHWAWAGYSVAFGLIAIVVFTFIMFLDCAIAEGDESEVDYKSRYWK